MRLGSWFVLHNDAYVAYTGPNGLLSGALRKCCDLTVLQRAARLAETVRISWGPHESGMRAQSSQGEDPI